MYPKAVGMKIQQHFSICHETGKPNRIGYLVIDVPIPRMPHVIEYTIELMTALSVRSELNI